MALNLKERASFSPLKIHSLYMRVWIVKTVYIVDVREGFKKVIKGRNKFKAIFGLVSK